MSQGGRGYGGTNALGNAAGQAFGLLNSIALSFGQTGLGGDPSNSVGLYTNGATPYGSGLATGVSFNTTINVTVTYSGTTLTVNINSGAFTHSFTGLNIPTIVGGSTAYVGFTGSSGGGNYGVQALTAWTL
jgi:hypothetical protein